MILELTISRGLGLRIDGHKPAAPDWGYGENDDNTGYEFNNNGLRVGPHLIKSIDFGVDLDRWQECEAKLEALTLTTEDGVFVLPVIDDFAGTEDCRYRVRLTDGTVKEIDEYVTYVRAGEGPHATREEIEDDEAEADEPSQDLSNAWRAFHNKADDESA